MRHAPGERNYHIFYQLLSSVATDQALASECELTSPELFDYLNPKGQGVTSVDGISDEQDFADLKNSMNVLRFDPTLISDIFNIVAGTLHFGNVKFKSVEIGGYSRRYVYRHAHSQRDDERHRE